MNQDGFVQNGGFSKLLWQLQWGKSRLKPLDLGTTFGQTLLNLMAWWTKIAQISLTMIAGPLRDGSKEVGQNEFLILGLQL